MKNNFLQAIQMKLIGKMPNDYIRITIDAITLALSDYELTEKCTDLIPYDGVNDNFMFKKFLINKQMLGFSPRSIKHYSFVIKKFAEYVTLPLQKITTDNVVLYLSKKSFQDKVSPVTLVNIKRILNSFFTYLHKEKYIEENPVYRVENIKIPKRLKTPLSDEQLELLRCGAKTLRDKAMIDFLFSTAVRCSELCSLNISDVNFNTGTVRVIGKGNKERYVFLSAKAKISLQKYLEVRKDSNPALFCGLRASANKRLNIAGVEIRLRQLGNELGISNVHPHRLRRTMATIALRTAPINVVSKLLGHENITTTTLYGITDMEQVQAAHRIAIS